MVKCSFILLIVAFGLAGCAAHDVTLTRKSSQKDFDRANRQIRKVLSQGDFQQVIKVEGDSPLTSEVWVGAPGSQQEVLGLFLGRDSSAYILRGGERRKAATFELNTVSLMYPAWGSLKMTAIGTFAGAIGGWALMSAVISDSVDNPGPHTGSEWRATGVAALVGAGLGLIVGFISGHHDSGHDIVLQRPALAVLPAPYEYRLSLNKPCTRWPQRR